MGLSTFGFLDFSGAFAELRRGISGAYKWSWARIKTAETQRGGTRRTGRSEFASGRRFSSGKRFTQFVWFQRIYCRLATKIGSGARVVPFVLFATGIMARRRRGSGSNFAEGIAGLAACGLLLFYLQNPELGRKVIQSLPLLIGGLLGLGLLVILGLVASRFSRVALPFSPASDDSCYGGGATSRSKSNSSLLTPADVALREKMAGAGSNENGQFQGNPFSVPGNLLGSAQKLDWFKFEKLTELVYQKLGYQVERRGGANPDGGIDLIITNGAERVGVQCKHWKAWKVGVQEARAFLGALKDFKLDRGILITTHEFTMDARDFADRNGIELVDDAALLGLMKRADAGNDREFARLFSDRRKVCPKCEREMVLRKATKGRNVNRSFWGCSGFPKCRYTEK